MWLNRRQNFASRRASLPLLPHATSLRLTRTNSVEINGKTAYAIMPVANGDGLKASTTTRVPENLNRAAH